MTLPVHPVTGEMLDPDPSSIVGAIRETEEYLSENLWPIRRRLNALRGLVEPTLPNRPRDRTDTQAKISSCPRCGHADGSAK